MHGTCGDIFLTESISKKEYDYDRIFVDVFFIPCIELHLGVNDHKL